MVLGLIKIIGIIIFLYLVWRNLYDDYRNDLLISYGWGSILVMLIGGRAVYGLQNLNNLGTTWGSWMLDFSLVGYSMLGGLLCIFFWTWWFCYYNEWKLWPFLEDMTSIYYLLIAFMVGEDFVRSGLDLRLLLGMVIALTGYLLANVMKAKYRSLTWYRSGKKGFIFFFTNMIIAIVLSVTSLLYKDGWIIIGSYLILSLIFAWGLVILGDLFNSLIPGRKTNG